jgi:hypothetical protein
VGTGKSLDCEGGGHHPAIAAMGSEMELYLMASVLAMAASGQILIAMAASGSTVGYVARRS